MEWIKYGKSWREFRKEKLAVVGTRIRVSVKEYLIGDINILGGVCDDCMDFGYEEIVAEYLPTE